MLDRWPAVVESDHDQSEATLPTDASLLLALLPLALFYHDAPDHLGPVSDQVFLSLKAGLRGELAFAQRLSQRSALDWCRIQVAWRVFALALAQICRGPLDPLTLIPQVMTTLATTTWTPLTDETQEQGNRQELGATQPPTPIPTAITRCLQGVQQRLTQGAGLTAILPWLIDQTGTGIESQVALALSCFLSAPRDFRCAVVRSLQTTQRQPCLAPHAPWIAALTGALVGSYQGAQGLPVMIASAPMSNTGEDATRRSPKAGPAVFQQILPLLAAWAGIDQPHQHASLPVVIAPTGNRSAN